MANSRFQGIVLGVAAVIVVGLVVGLFVRHAKQNAEQTDAGAAPNYAVLDNTEFVHPAHP